MALLTVRDIAARVRLFVDEAVDDLVAQKIVDLELRSLWNDHKWSFAKTDPGTAITTTASKSAGTVALTLDSDQAVGTGTSFVAGDVGSYLKLPNGKFYRADSLATQTITMSSVYTGTTDATATYTLLKHHYDLASDVTQIISMVGLDWQLEEKTMDWFDSIDPDRDQTGDPIYFSYIAPKSDGTIRVELWPVPNTAATLPYVGLKRGSVAAATDLVKDLESLVLKKSIESACRLAAAKAADSEGRVSWLQLANSYENQSANAMFNMKRRDRRWYGIEQDRASSLGDRYRDDPSVDLGGSWSW